MHKTKILLFLLLFLSASVWASPPVVEVTIHNHLFYPAVINIPAHTKVKLLIINEDSTSEEFESYELNREKVIKGKQKAIVFIGPLSTGEYPFLGEFFPQTAQGKVIVK